MGVVCLYHQFPTYTEILPFRNVFVHCERAVSGLNGVLTTCVESNTHTCAEESCMSESRPQQYKLGLAVWSLSI